VKVGNLVPFAAAVPTNLSLADMWLEPVKFGFVLHQCLHAVIHRLPTDEDLQLIRQQDCLKATFVCIAGVPGHASRQ